MSDSVTIGMRIPKDYFVTRGKGESDITIHAGSYHLALKDAKIEMCNIMTYSSIMPSIANKIERPKTLTHDAVMETINITKKHGTALVAICFVNYEIPRV